MIESIEIFFTVVVTGMSIALTVIFAWFIIGLMVNFWKVYVHNPSVKKYNQKIKNQESCDHSNSRYTESHPDLVWTCNDCGKIH